MYKGTRNNGSDIQGSASLSPTHDIPTSVSRAAILLKFSQMWQSLCLITVAGTIARNNNKRYCTWQYFFDVSCGRDRAISANAIQINGLVGLPGPADSNDKTESIKCNQYRMQETGLPVCNRRCWFNIANTTTEREDERFDDAECPGPQGFKLMRFAKT
ncbi:hypothetical protein HG530_004607 [Fusarium avenaceum]|nr:hypothetical protein HG530_004607 [Fusarium avenaceum]